MLFYCIYIFFNDSATTEIYTLSLHDALPISTRPRSGHADHSACSGGRIMRPWIRVGTWWAARGVGNAWIEGDRKSTRLNSSHANISYAAFFLKKNIRLSSLTYSDPS